jgi:hypothetical protein
MLIILEAVLANIILVGYGIFFKKIFRLRYVLHYYSESIFFGLIFLSFFGLLINFFLPLNSIVSFLIFSFGILLFFLDFRKNFNKKKELCIFLITSSLLVLFVLSFSKVYDDFGLYHLPSVIRISESNISLGVSNINFRYGHNFILFYVMAFFTNDILGLQGILLIEAIIYVNFLIFLLNNFYKRRNPFLEKLSLFLLIIFLVKFFDFGDQGLDVPIVIFFFLIIYYFVHIFYLNKQVSVFNFFKIIFILSLFIISLKLSQILIIILPLTIFFYFRNLLVDYEKIKYYLMIATPFFLWLLSNLLLSSCILYPVKQTCLNTSWSPPQENWNSSPAEVYTEISAWSKGWIDSLPGRGAKVEWENRGQVLNHMKNFTNGEWKTVWFNVHFKEKIFKNILFYLSIIVLFYFSFRKNNINYFNDSANILNKYLLIFSSLSIVFWFNTAPLLRFGFAQIILFIFCLGNIFLLNNIRIFPKKKNTQLIVIVSLSIFFIRNAFLQKVNNFKIDYLRPYPSFYSKSVIKSQPAYDTLIFFNNLILNISNGANCFDIPFPCSDFIRSKDKSNIDIKKELIFKKFIVIKN